MRRLRILITGRCTWIDENTGDLEREVLSWRSRWAIFGVHSSDWRWVRRFGKRDCGCTFNPLTRRRVLTAMDCETHGVPLRQRDSAWLDAWVSDWYSDDEWEREWM